MIPPLTENALRYAWRQLLRRAGVVKYNLSGNGCIALGLTLRYGDAWDADIIIERADPQAWHALLNQSERTLNWFTPEDVLPPGATWPFDGKIPVLFWADGAGPDFVTHRAPGKLVFHADILAATIFMLSRWEEQGNNVRDAFGRFPAEASVAHQQGFLELPIVDMYGLILRAWLQYLRPGWHGNLPTFRVNLTHDVDFIQPFPTPYAAVRKIAGDVLKRRSLKQATRNANQAVRQLLAPDTTAYLQSLDLLSDLSLQHGLRSTFYFMASEPSPEDTGYSLNSPLAQKRLRFIKSCGFEIGLHAGYYTFRNPDKLRTEKARLEKVLEAPVQGGRQHYLRFQAPDTWRHWEQASFQYDSTLCYAQRNGFRCGTCHPYTPFDIEQDNELALKEIPLIVMDRTLLSYTQLSEEEAEDEVLKLARRCQSAHGTFTLLWHNILLVPEWRPWLELYNRILNRLVKLT